MFSQGFSMPDPRIAPLMPSAFGMGMALAQARMKATGNRHLIGLAAIPVHLTTIDAQALSVVQGSWPPSSHRWQSVLSYLPYETLWFDSALWSGTTLCGIAVGHQARHVRPDTLDITEIQGSPLGHPLKGATRFYIAETGAALATLIPTIRRVRLKNPVNAKVTALYSALQFDPAVDPPHCVRNV